MFIPIPWCQSLCSRHSGVMNVWLVVRGLRFARHLHHLFVVGVRTVNVMLQMSPCRGIFDVHGCIICSVNQDKPITLLANHPVQSI